MIDIKFLAKNLPVRWSKFNKSDFKISQNKLNELKNKFQFLKEKSIVLYVKDGCPLLIKETYETIDYFGIDFNLLFTDIIQGNSNLDVPDKPDVIVIYNIGLENALNKEYAGQILRGIIERVKNKGKSIILCSYLSYTEFNKMYKIDIVNKLSISLKEEEKVF